MNSTTSPRSLFLATPNLGWIRTGLHERVVAWSASHEVERYAPEGLRPVAYAKNVCVEEFLRRGCEYLWFVDADTVPPFDAPDLLLHAGVEVVAGVVRQFKQDVDGVAKPVPMICRAGPGGLRPVLRGAGVEKIDACGAGCLMVHRSVFERLGPPPWFEQGSWGSERGSDFNFCARLRDAGVPIHAHFGVRCLHYKDVGF